MDAKAPVAIVMIARNEAHNMAAVLDNVTGWAQEVFLVDSLSSDATVDIALRYGVHVVQRGFLGFGDQWNFALNELPITASWTMKLDPDERLTSALKLNITAAIQKGDANALRIRRRLWFMGRPLPVRQELVRLWRTGTCTFSDVLVNEHPLVQDPVVSLPGDLEHHDSPQLHHWVEKQNYYSTAEAIAAYRQSRLSAEPKLFGTGLERRMWFKSNFRFVPFRYSIMFLFNLVAYGAWRAGRVGFSWAWLRAELYRMRDLKLDEMRFLGREYDLPRQVGRPDFRVPQYDAARRIAAGDESEGTRRAGVAFHAPLADGWDRRYSKGGFLRRAKFFAGQILPRLNSQGRWLDVGCGSGYFARILGDRGADVEGIDGSGEMIGAAARISISQQRARNPQFKTVASVERLDYPSASFDGAICLSVLEYLDQPETCFAEIVRILRPGGQLVVSVPNRPSVVRKLQRTRLFKALLGAKSYLVASRWDWTPDDLKALASAHQLSGINVFEFDALISPAFLKVLPASLLFLVARKAGAPALVEAALSR
jgi:SAM-dependent methyltransferase